MKILLLHNIISPYRVPLFNSIATNEDLTVYYCRRISSDRAWNITTPMNYKHFVGNGFSAGPLVVTPRLIKHLVTHTYDTYVITDNDEDVLSSIAAYIAAKLRRKPIAIWSGHVERSAAYLKLAETKWYYKPFYGIYRLFFRLFRAFLYKHAQAVITYCEATNDFLRPLLPATTPVFTGTQVMPLDLLPAPSVTSSENDTKTVLYLGYLRIEKNVDVLINAFNKLKTPNVRLIIVGNGPDKPRLMAMAKGNDAIIFAPNAAGIEKANYFATADVFVLPTLYDPWGLVVNEAVRYGTPLVVSKAAGAREVIEHGKNGYLFDPQDADMLRDRLSDILDNPTIGVAFREAMKDIEPRLLDVSYAQNTFTKLFDCLRQR